MAEQAKNTVIEIKADLNCSRCYKKIKRLLCKYHQIRNQIFNEKQNTVIITVYCCSPEKIIRKLESKGGKTIQSIKIKEPEIKKADGEKPKQEAAAKPSPKTDAAPTPPPPDVKQEKPKSKPAPTPPVDAKPNQAAPKPETGGKPAQAEKQKEAGAKKSEKPEGKEGEAAQGGKKQADQSAGKKVDEVKFIMDPVAAAPGYPSQWFPNSVYIPPQPTSYDCYYGYREMAPPVYYQGYGGRTGCDCGGRRICQNQCDCNFSEENPTAACVIM